VRQTATIKVTTVSSRNDGRRIETAMSAVESGTTEIADDITKTSKDNTKRGQNTKKSRRCR
jgi:hypothetical protein